MKTTHRIYVFTLICFAWLPLSSAESDVRLQVSSESGKPAQNSTSGQTCCTKLFDTCSSFLSYPQDPVYRQEQNGTALYGYWSAIEIEQHPTCRVTPSTTSQVSEAVRILAANDCKFAIRSGGHTPWAGSSNVDDGVTIDLSLLNNVVIHPANSTVSIGPGARWGDVYTTLRPHNISVSGGRVSSVGVGGLTLGGGKSFFASLYGFAADGVENFEVVLASGAIVDANVETHPHLWRALKGGTSNFGVVTRFDVRSFPQGDMWAGQVVYPLSTLPRQLDALATFTQTQGEQSNSSADAQVIWALATSANYQIIANYYSYTQPHAWPADFAPFHNISEVVTDTTRIGALPEFAEELNQGTPNGYRYLFATATIGNNAQLFKDLAAFANSTFQPFVARGTADILFSFVLQPLTKPMLQRGCGRNVLGLCPADGNLMILDLTMQWGDAQDDVAIDESARKLVAAAMKMARDKGVYNEYQYLNYAAPWQQPLANYGTENVQLMQKVAKKFDPDGVFQRNVGGYKLPQ